jgi:hypothetical protein
MENFVTFWKFNTIEESKELTDALSQNQIHYIIENDSPDVDLTFTGNQLEKEFHVKISKNDFNKAYEILEELSVNNTPIDDKNKDYYLFEFSDDELMEILENYDEWSIYDYKLAQRILKERGKEVDKTRLEQLKKDRLDLLRVPKKAVKGWLIFGLVFSIFGGLTGIIIGWYHLSVKTLPDGERVFIYEDNIRRLSKILLYTGLFFFIAELLIFIIKTSYN